MISDRGFYMVTKLKDKNALGNMLTYLEQTLRDKMRVYETGSIDFITLKNGTFEFDFTLPEDMRHIYGQEAIQALSLIIKTRMLIIERRHCGN